MKMIIDRFEGDVAVLEMIGGLMVTVPRAIIPPDAREGSVLVIEVNTKETEMRQKRIADLMKDVWSE